MIHASYDNKTSDVLSRTISVLLFSVSNNHHHGSRHSSRSHTEAGGTVTPHKLDSPISNHTIGLVALLCRILYLTIEKKIMNGPYFRTLTSMHVVASRDR